MKIAQTGAEIWHSFLDIIFPRACIHCKRLLLLQEQFYCLSCEVSLSKTRFYRHTDNDLYNVFRPHAPIEFAGACFYFIKDTLIQDVLHEIKYKDNQKLLAQIGEKMGTDFRNYIKDKIPDVDLVVPVPMFRRKKQKRGYNQAELLANHIAAELNVPIANDVLKCKRGKVSQTKKGRLARWINAESVFKLNNPKQAENKHIVLIDDVVTTGATMLACLKELMKIEGIKMSVYSLAFAIQK